MAHINKFGQEVLDPTPKCLPVPFQHRELTIFDRIQMQLAAFKRENAPDETPEDMLDFGEDRDDYPDFESYPSAAEMAEKCTRRVPAPKVEPEPKPEPEPKLEPPVDGE